MGPSKSDDEIAVKASHKASLTELNMSVWISAGKVGILTRQPWNAVQLST